MLSSLPGKTSKLWVRAHSAPLRQQSTPLFGQSYSTSDEWSEASVAAHQGMETVLQLQLATMVHSPAGAFPEDSFMLWWCSYHHGTVWRDQKCAGLHVLRQLGGGGCWLPPELSAGKSGKYRHSLRWVSNLPGPVGQMKAPGPVYGSTDQPCTLPAVSIPAWPQWPWAARGAGVSVCCMWVQSKVHRQYHGPDDRIPLSVSLTSLV